MAAPPGIAERVTRDYISSSVGMGNDSDQDEDDEHMTSAENAPNYTNNHHHVVLVEGGRDGVNEQTRSGPSRNVGYYDATSLYPSSGVLYRHFFARGICRAGGPARAKRGLATDPAAAAAAGRSPPGGDLSHVPEGRGLVSKPMYLYFF